MGGWTTYKCQLYSRLGWRLRVGLATVVKTPAAQVGDLGLIPSGGLSDSLSPAYAKCSKFKPSIHRKLI